MKQLNLSNIIAIVAVLLCFYAFAGEKTSSPNTEEKEYCILRSCARCRMHILAYSSGKYESPRMDDYFKSNDDIYFLKLTSQTINKLCSEGWIIKSQSIVSDVPGTIVEQYLFERTKQ